MGSPQVANRVVGRNRGSLSDFGVQGNSLGWASRITAAAATTITLLPPSPRKRKGPDAVAAPVV